MAQRSYKKRARRPEPPKRSNRSTFLALGLAVILAIGALVWHRVATPSPLDGLVETYASEGAAHVPTGQRVTYRSDPPHSGPHYAQVARPGFYDRPIPDEVIVHNLEHGNIVVFYDPERLNSEDEAYLTRLTRTYTGDWDAVLAVPRQGMTHPFILSAWRHLLRLDTLDRVLVEAFMDAYRGRGPENPVR